MKYKNSKISNISYDCLLSILDSPEEKLEIYLGLRNVYNLLLNSFGKVSLCNLVYLLRLFPDKAEFFDDFRNYIVCLKVINQKLNQRFIINLKF